MLRTSLTLLRRAPLVGRRSLSDMSLTLASPGEVFYSDAKVKQVDVPTLTGNIGVLANHVPLLGCLKPGVVAVYEEDGGVKKYFVSSGSITINDDSSVQILAEELASLQQLDAAAARDGLAKAQQAAHQAAGGERERAEAEVQVETYEAIVKALEENK